MTSQAEFDRVLTIWMADGPERVPEERMRAALADVAGTSQKRVLRVPTFARGSKRSPRPAALFAVIAIALVAMAGIGMGIRAGLTRVPNATPLPQPTPDDALADDWRDFGFELFANEADGYAVALPAEWLTGVDQSAGRDPNTAIAFGSGRGAGTHGSPALRITVGEADGTIHLCATCSDEVRSIEQLEELLVSTPSFYTSGPAEQHGDLLVAGGPARYEAAGIGNDCLGCQGAYYHVYFIHDGRPVVLKFDYWTVRFRSMVVSPGHEVAFTAAMLTAILQSFTFVDDGSAADRGPSVVTEDGYRVILPANWTGRIGSADVRPGRRRTTADADRIRGEGWRP